MLYNLTRKYRDLVNTIIKFYVVDIKFNVQIINTVWKKDLIAHKIIRVKTNNYCGSKVIYMYLIYLIY